MSERCTARRWCRRKRAPTRSRSIAGETRSTRFCRGRIAPRYFSTRLDEVPAQTLCTRTRGATPMKWITREHVKVDRVACPWLIKKFVDKSAEFVFVPADKVMDEARRLDAIPYDVKNVELATTARNARSRRS